MGRGTSLVGAGVEAGPDPDAGAILGTEAGSGRGCGAPAPLGGGMGRIAGFIGTPGVFTAPEPGARGGGAPGDVGGRAIGTRLTLGAGAGFCAPSLPGGVIGLAGVCCFAIAGRIIGRWCPGGVATGTRLTDPGRASGTWSGRRFGSAVTGDGRMTELEGGGSRSGCDPIGGRIARPGGGIACGGVGGSIDA